MYLTFKDQFGTETNVDVPCLYRGALYRDHLRDALAKFQNYSIKAGEFYRDALCDHKLLGLLAGLLDKYLLAPSAKMLNSTEGRMLSYEELFNRFDAAHPGMFSLQTVALDTDPDALQEFRRQFPLMAYAMKRITEQFSTYVLDVCQKIQADLPDIRAAFFNNAPIRKLLRIQGTGSDLHKGGRQVLILSFDVDDMARAGGRVIFKPGDIEVDYLFVGDTKRVVYDGGEYKVNGEPTFHSVSKILNYFFEKSSIKLQLPTYTILPRNPGSSLVARERQLPIRNSYGYIQFLSNEPDFDEKTGNPVTEGVAADGQPWDWIGADDSEASNYFRQCGALIAMAEIFGIFDMHMENIIVHKRQPHLIDLEISFRHSVDKRARVDLETSGLKSFSHPKGERKLARSKDWVIEPGNENEWFRNRLRKQDGTIARIDDYRDAVNWGYERAMDVFRSEGRSFIDLLRKTPVSNLITRALPLGTDVWSLVQRWFRETKFDYVGGAVEDLERQPVAHMEQIFTPYLASFKEEQTKYLKSNKNQEPEWVTMQPIAGLRDVYECDIPTFYHRISERDILNSRGEILPLPSKDEDRAGSYFTHAAIDIVIEKLRALHNRD